MSSLKTKLSTQRKAEAKIFKVFQMSNWQTEKQQLAYYNEIASMTPSERGQLVELLHNADEVKKIINK